MFHNVKGERKICLKFVILVKNTTLNDGENKGRQDIENIGSGEGYYITNGKAIEIIQEALNVLSDNEVLKVSYNELLSELNNLYKKE